MKNTAEHRYATVEKEALAIKWAVLELRYYLLGQKFTLVTDHAPLQWMARVKDTNARVTRWFLVLQDFHFIIRHQAGTANANADGLSHVWAGLSGFTSRPTSVSPLFRRTRTTLRGGGECDACPERPECSSASPWERRMNTCAPSSPADRPQLRLIRHCL